MINPGDDRIKIKGHIGTWHSIDQKTWNGRFLHLLEHDTYGDDAPMLIVDRQGTLVLDDVWNGWDDLEYLEEEGFI